MAEKNHHKDILLNNGQETIQAFSFVKYIVLSEADFQENKKVILLHEEAHKSDS